MLEYWIMLPLKSTLLANQETMETPYETSFDQRTKDKFIYRVFLDFSDYFGDVHHQCQGKVGTSHFENN